MPIQKIGTPYSIRPFTVKANRMPMARLRHQPAGRIRKMWAVTASTETGVWSLRIA